MSEILHSKEPLVSVIMPVYNGEVYLSEAIESILSQTLSEYEFIIINDGSTDNSPKIISSYSDPRIRSITHEKNCGLTHSLNVGLKTARGKYIARMDCDDISLPERFEKQVAFMDTHADIGVCGTWVYAFGSSPEGAWHYPVDHDVIKASMVFGPVFAHPSVMIRSDVLCNNDLYYNEELHYAQDFDLWIRLLNCTRGANIPEVLLKYRIHGSQIGRAHKNDQEGSAIQIYQSLMQKIGVEPTSEELQLHADLARYRFETTKTFLTTSRQWLERLYVANKTKGYFAQPDFSKVLADRWFALCLASANLGVWTWRQFTQSPFFRHVRVGRRRKLRFMLCCLFKGRIFKKV